MIPAIVTMFFIGIILGVILGSVVTVRYSARTADRDREIIALKNLLHRYEEAMPVLRERDALEGFDRLIDGDAAHVSRHERKTS